MLNDDMKTGVRYTLFHLHEYYMEINFMSFCTWFHEKKILSHTDFNQQAKKVTLNILRKCKISQSEKRKQR